MYKGKPQVEPTEYVITEYNPNPELLSLCRFSLFLPSLEQILKPVFFRSEIPGITLKYESGL